jgi:putative transcriptional regulator
VFKNHKVVDCDKKSHYNCDIRSQGGAKVNKNQWLIDIRNALDMTQEEVADRAGIGRSWYTKIENGSNPGHKTAKSIAAVLGFDWTLFFEQNCDVSSQEKSA